MKKIFSVMAITFFLVVAFGYTSFACDKGCTPGYWKQKQHFDSWVAPYTPQTKFKDVFACDNSGGLSLLAALKKGGGGMYALRRHAVASLLNCAAISCFDGNGGYAFDPQATIDAYCEALSGDIEGQKNLFEMDNDQTCHLN